MQLVMTVILLAGLVTFGGLIILVTLGTIADIVSGGGDKAENTRKELWRMTGDPKDKP